MSESQRTYASGDQTRNHLILVAEALFAESGIDSVSMRQVNVAAGQKNSSAAHYHFGSKDALILSIYQHRMAHVNERRVAMLDELEQGRKNIDVRDLIETIVQPIVAEIEADDSGRSYIRFMAQTIGHPQLDLIKLWKTQHSDGLTRNVDLLIRAIPNVPDSILRHRFGLAIQQIIQSLAEREKLRPSNSRADNSAASLFMNNLVDYLAGAMAAPVSENTKRLLKKTSPKKKSEKK